jgi:chorismate mutase
VSRDDADEVVSATAELLADIIAANDLSPDDMVSIIFTATNDISSQFPAVAARNMGLATVPLICARACGIAANMPSNSSDASIQRRMVTESKVRVILRFMEKPSGW